MPIRRLLAQPETAKLFREKEEGKEQLVSID
jgi:hypothetical protein